MKAKALLLLMVVALMGAVALAPARAANAAPPAPAGVTLPITGSDPLGNTLNGVANITSFAVQNGQLTAIGTLTGTLTNSLGTVVGNITNLPISLPVNLLASTGSCQILDLVLGPINLNLLGLQVTTNQIHLNITAQAGPGNLLGNLLCAVANLLNSNGPLSGLTGLLNNLLRNL